jgi:hypothetical protein
LVLAPIVVMFLMVFVLLSRYILAHFHVSSNCYVFVILVFSVMSA